MKIATILFVLFITNSAFAGTDKPVFKIKNAGEKTFYFETKGMNSSFVEVEFLDENGNIIFNEYAINTATFERKYNLNELATGAYVLFVKYESKTLMLPITVTKHGLEIDSAELELVQ